MRGLDYVTRLSFARFEPVSVERVVSLIRVLFDV